MASCTVACGITSGYYSELEEEDENVTTFPASWFNGRGKTLRCCNSVFSFLLNIDFFFLRILVPVTTTLVSRVKPINKEVNRLQLETTISPFVVHNQSRCQGTCGRHGGAVLVYDMSPHTHTEVTYYDLADASSFIHRDKRLFKIHEISATVSIIIG